MCLLLEVHHVQNYFEDPEMHAATKSSISWDSLNERLLILWKSADFEAPLKLMWTVVVAYRKALYSCLNETAISIWEDEPFTN